MTPPRRLTKRQRAAAKVQRCRQCDVALVPGKRVWVGVLTHKKFCSQECFLSYMAGGR